MKKRKKSVSDSESAKKVTNVEDNPLLSPMFDPIGMWTGIPFIAPTDIPVPEQDPDDL